MFRIPRWARQPEGVEPKVVESLILSADGVLSVMYPSLLVVMEGRGRFKPGCGLCPEQAGTFSKPSIEGCRKLATGHLSRMHLTYPNQSIHARTKHFEFPRAGEIWSSWREIQSIEEPSCILAGARDSEFLSVVV